jgi:hypothetical protein
MAESQFQNVWGTTTSFSSFTALHSLADTNIWRSGEITDTSPTMQGVQISYNIVGVTPGTDDALHFWVVGSDGDGTTPYRPGSIDNTEGAITTAASIADALQAVGQPNHIHGWITNHGTTFRGMFIAFLYRPSWQVLIRTSGMSLAASGNVVRYRYITAQTVGV